MKNKTSFFELFFQYIKKNQWFLLYAVFSAFSIGVAYQKLTNLYYLNDEWDTLAGIYSDGIWTVFKTFSWWELLIGRGRVLGGIIQHILFYCYPFQAWPFAFISYISHFINSLLVFYFIRRITKSIPIAFATGILFVTASAYHQAFSWIATAVQVPLSTTFILLSLLSMYIYSETSKRRYIFWAYFSAYIAFLFKDASYYIFLLIPIEYLIFNVKKLIWSTSAIIFSPSLLIALLFALSRVSVVFDMTKSTLVQDSKGLIIGRILFNSIFYPLLTLSQVLIPVRYMVKLSAVFGNFFYPYLLSRMGNTDVLVNFIFSDMIAIFLSFVMIIFMIVSYCLNQFQKRSFLFVCIFHILSFVPISAYLFIRGSSYIESRYLYIPAITVSLMVVLTSWSIYMYVKKRNDIIGRLVLIFLFLLFIGYSAKEISITRREVYANVIQGNDIKQVIQQMKVLYPKLPDRSVVYITGDADFFGYQHHPLPFQLGTGFMISMIYYPSGVIPTSFIHERYLMSFSSQGYRDENEKAFGYFWDLSLLKKTVKDKRITQDKIIGLYYDSSKKELRDVSKDIRQSIFIDEIN
jgi:hypothetical protein